MENEESQNPVDRNDTSEKPEPAETITAPDTVENEERTPSGIDSLPAISNWENASGFSTLGVIVSILLGGVLSALPDDIYIIIFTVLSILYILIFYRSYFTEKPLAKSSKVISFLNFAFMGVVFGWCFNNNIRRSKISKRADKGTSHIVAIVLLILIAGGSLYYYNFTTSGYMAKNYDYNPRTGEYTPKSGNISTQSTTKSASSSMATIPSTNTTIKILDRWESQEYSIESASDGKALAIFSSYASQNTALLIRAIDMSNYVTDEFREQGGKLDIHNVSENAVLEDNRSNMDTVEKESAEIVQLNGVDYWKAQTLGTYSGSPLKDTSYYCYAGNYLYQFTLSSYNESDSTNTTLEADQEKMIRSVIYQ